MEPGIIPDRLRRLQGTACTGFKLRNEMSPSNNLLMAAIDIGSSAIRMDVAEIKPDGTIRILDSLKKGVQLGREVFTEGHLSQDTIRAACEALRDFKKVMDSYGVSRYRAVATSAVRESSNSETFLDRILMSTGLDVEIIDGPEENRLTLSAVMDSLRGESDIWKRQKRSGRGWRRQHRHCHRQRRRAAAIEHAAAGIHTPSRRTGRRTGKTGTAGPTAEASDKQLSFKPEARNGDPRCGSLHRAGRRCAPGRRNPQRFRTKSTAGRIPKDALSDLVDSLSKLTTDALVQKYSIHIRMRKRWCPRCSSMSQILKETQAQDLIVTDANIRAGILQDLAPVEEGKRRKKLSQQILSAARSLGRKYHFDESHAERVRELSTRLFDELKAEQRMTDTHRLYLEVAALLHDIGAFISPRSHHKHSQYSSPPPSSSVCGSTKWS